MSTSGSHAKLLRILGVVFGIAVVVGSMVGQGILRTPGIIAGAVSSPALVLVLWLLGGGFAAISAFAYVELGAAIPWAGGPYDFIRRAFGPLAGVIGGWAAWFVLITAQAFFAIVVGEFLHRIGVFPTFPTSILAVGAVALFTALNWTGTRISGNSQILFSALKGAALVGLVILLLAHSGTYHASVGPAVAVSLGGIAVAMRAIYNTYDGWTDIVYFDEEIEAPGRNLPRAMAADILGVTVLYLLVNVALLHALSPAQMVGSKLPAADAADRLFGGNGGLAMTLLGVLSVSAILNLNIMKSARVAFALARAGYLPRELDSVAQSGTPRAALIASTIIGASFAATGTYQTVVAMNVAVSAALVAIVNLAAIRLRRVEPELARPFQIPLFPLPPVIAIILNLALVGTLFFEDPAHSFEGFVLLAAIGAVYAALSRIRVRAETPAA